MEEAFCVAIDGAGRIAGSSAGLDLRTQCWSNALSIKDDAILRELRADCAAISFPATADTFWLSAEDFDRPSTLIEQLAAEIFRFHTAGAIFDPKRSGAEYWAQVRRGPRARAEGEREGHGARAGDAATQSPASRTPRSGAPIAMHWDKDELFFAESTIFIHPQLSTVTYLTPHGSPTVILNHTTRQQQQQQQLQQQQQQQIQKQTENDVVEVSQHTSQHTKHHIDSAYVSLPDVGKHLVFDGLLLHGAPYTDEVAAGQVRVTLLVNIWLEHVPVGVRSLPQAKAGLMTKPIPAAGAQGLEAGTKASCSASSAVSSPPPPWRLSRYTPSVPPVLLEITDEIESEGAGTWHHFPLRQKDPQQVLRCKLPSMAALDVVARSKVKSTNGNDVQCDRDSSSGDHNVDRSLVQLRFNDGCEATVSIPTSSQAHECRPSNNTICAAAAAAARNSTISNESGNQAGTQAPAGTEEASPSAKRQKLSG